MADENKTEEAVEQTAPEAQAQANNAPDLNVSDLTAVKSIIDVATQRGAFKANELEDVGKVYNKLTAFLEGIAEQQKNSQG
jgi:uncharacterized ubiquitin-like protein YukD